MNLEEKPDMQVSTAEASDVTKGNERVDSIKSRLITGFIPVLVVEATSKCNLRCVFCGMHSKNLFGPPKRESHMTLDVFREVIEKCKTENRLKVLYLHGNGEPLLNPNIVEMVAYARSNDIAEKIILVTNGVLLTPNVFEGLSKAGISEVRVSLDAITPEVFHKTKGVDVGVKVVQNLDKCIEAMQDRIGDIKLVILCSNPEDKELGEEAKKIVNHYKTLIKDSSKVNIQFRSIFGWVESINRSLCVGDGQYMRSVPCEQPFYLLMVHSDGDISMCCADSAKKLIVASIKEISSLKEAVQSPKLRELRKNLLLLDTEKLPVCKGCEVYSSADNALLNRRYEILKLIL